MKYIKQYDLFILERNFLLNFSLNESTNIQQEYIK